MLHAWHRRNLLSDGGGQNEDEGRKERGKSGAITAVHESVLLEAKTHDGRPLARDIAQEADEVFRRRSGSDSKGYEWRQAERSRRGIGESGQGSGGVWNKSGEWQDGQSRVRRVGGETHRGGLMMQRAARL
jgi:hypothetical protein